MKRTAKWLKDMLSNNAMTQKELARLSGLSLSLIHKLTKGERAGDAKTWEAIESVFNSTEHVMTLTASDGRKLKLKVLGHQKPIYEMVEIAQAYGHKPDIVADYILSMSGLFQELLESQADIMGSDEAFTYDPHTTRVLGQLAEDFLTDYPTLLKYFRKWLGEN